ncbi:S8 family serine peptidase [Pseudocolwellia sp. HL-MZ19]|uniref:S8 family serine peptidase n=1 Tax=Pseudocolwellia sp. HL-MZ19 TaxID=3400846 RepID=UPI003CF107AA
MKSFTKAAWGFLLSITFSTSLMANGLLGKQLSTIENSILNDSIINRQTDIINNRVDRIKNKTQSLVDLEQLLTHLPEGEVSSLIAPVGSLTESINILDTAGNTLFREVEVENGWRAIEHQWLVMTSEDELKQLQQLVNNNAIELISTKNFNALTLTLVQFKVKPSFDNTEQLASILPKSLHKKLARDYVYQTQSKSQDANISQATSASLADREADKIENLNDESRVDEILDNAACLAPLSIGIVDTAIDIQHPVFKNKTITRQRFIDENLAAPKAHGTAVSALLVSNSAEVPALLPHAKLFAAEVFYGQNDFSQGANLFNLVSGINWLLSQEVSVINMSLAGPDNTILANVINIALTKNIAIVAAVGNDGPHSPPLYPAAYKNVIGVTAVDDKNRLYRWANRGDYVDFSARGVSVKTARLSGDFGFESGTSMAAPVITAYTACAKYQAEKISANYLDLLNTQALDLGDKGYDTLFGNGRIGS